MEGFCYADGYICYREIQLGSRCIKLYIVNKLYNVDPEHHVKVQGQRVHCMSRTITSGGEMPN